GSDTGRLGIRHGEPIPREGRWHGRPGPRQWAWPTSQRGGAMANRREPWRSPVQPLKRKIRTGGRMTAHFDPAVYVQLSPDARLWALGLCTLPAHEMDTYRGTALDILDTQARTREKFEQGPFSTQGTAREALKRWVIPLARHLARKRRPKGLE